MFDRFSQYKKEKAGFTLVEVIVVLIIIAIMAAVAVPAMTGYVQRAKDMKKLADAREACLELSILMVEWADENRNDKYKWPPSHEFTFERIKSFDSGVVSASTPAGALATELRRILGIDKYDPAISCRVWYNESGGIVRFAYRDNSKLSGTQYEWQFEAGKGWTKLT